MRSGPMLAVCVLCWSCTVCVVTAIQRAEIFPYGVLSGDSILAEGDDETSKVLSLPKPLYFYDSLFSQLYVATNGIISAQDLPMEKQYVDDGFPTDFPVVAPFLADIDTSGGRGQIYYRVTETPSVLNRVEAHRGFPDAKFTPTHAVVATWENVAAYEEQTRTAGPSNKLNTFQAVIGYDETDSYVLFLYPEGGLNFFGTRPKESYNVEIELPARVGFSRGEVTYFLISRTEGPYYSVTSNEQTVKNLYQVGNTGIPGVWLFHTGNRFSFDNIVPASVEDDYPLTGRDPEFQPASAAGGDHTDPLQPGSPDPPASPSEDADRQVYGSDNVPLTSEPRPGSEPAERQYAPPNPPQTVHERGAQLPQEPQPQVTPKHHSSGKSPFVKRTLLSGHMYFFVSCRFQQQCSQNAFCSDYATGFCCHCRPGFYGNGRHCLPDGAPQRVSGKVSGTVTVGQTPVQLNNIDLHAYIVVGDGRAYTAISEVPEPAGWALMPVAPIGELFGWLFALELPNSQGGFKITGAEFTRHAELLFYPGSQRLSITQTGRGLDDHNHLTVDTVLSGSVPFLPPGAEVTLDPFKETYQYYPSVATSTSVREFSVVSAERGSESFTFQVKQNITYRDCQHDNRAAIPETLQITMERVFVMYVKEERILRYAITNKISPVGVEPSGPELVNPCYAGSHDCDTTAQCIPLEGQAFQCQCATGYRGDGRNCYDIDECAEGVTTCGAHAQCVNLPGSHRCQCQTGYDFGFDGRTCVDVDECSSSPCHVNARCINELGSFRCQCQTGFHGDGFYCSQQEERPKTHCEHHRNSVQTTSPEGLPVIGVYVPQCDTEGQYTPLQCHGSSGHCWCVDSRGQERAGSRTSPGEPPKDYEPERVKTHCEHHRDSVQSTGPDGYPVVAAYVPQCDVEGQYIPLQCHGSTGHCWCVDSRGQERAGTRTPPGTTPKDCDRPGENTHNTHCEHHRDRAETTGPEGYSAVGAYVPQCDAEGQYIPLQCHGSSGHCWCVDSNGQERAGTRTPPGTQPKDCDKPERPKTHCEHHRERAQATTAEGYPAVGAFVPQCDADGQYISLQCHGSTGHCWCVDSNGQERAGTRTPPGTTPKDSEPQRPKTHCEHHRASVQSAGPEGYPAVGAYVPQCDAEGQYISRQCHGSTGHCWCVDSRGQERAGSRTPPGAARVDCDRPVSVGPTFRPESVCERWRASLIEHYGGQPAPQQYVPQCEPDGQFSPVQCYGETTYCWCVDQDGREVPGTRSHDAVKPACISSVAPPTVLPLPRPNVTPPTNTDVTLLYAQGQKIGALPLNGTRLDASRSKTLLTLHGSIVVGIAFDCKDNQVYWTDLSARTINRALMAAGAEPEILINTNLVSPEGLAVDVKRRLMFWVDSTPDVIESANLDGSGRRTLFDTDLVNPRAIIVVSSTGTLYWTDWNREAPKIESSSVDGQNRKVVVSDGIGLPNALTYDSSSGQVCWADAGTKRLECISPDGSGRRVIHPTLNYPFSMVYFRNHFYYTDWRRDGVIAVSKDSSQFTDEYLPEQRSHLYGIAIATTHCLPGEICVNRRSLEPDPMCC
uniref:Nidogen 2a (osteonidogen) n=1 Tax=Acanthochromis polyacanthus TaxID=80966 RepID=A0A3Q1G0X6_9TELE